MTLLVILQFSDCAIVLNDTLVTHRDGDPACFMLKLRHFRDPDVVMASTGNHAIPELWASTVAATADADVNDLHTVAPARLREIRDAVEAEHGPTGITTIHQLGYTRGTDELVHYEYSSRNDFAGERIVGDWVRVKPAMKAPHDPTSWASVHAVIDAAEQIQAEQRALYPDDGGVLIGGDLYCAEITPRGVEIGHVYRFADFDETLQKILAAQERRANTPDTNDTDREEPQS